MKGRSGEWTIFDLFQLLKGRDFPTLIRDGSYPINCRVKLVLLNLDVPLSIHVLAFIFFSDFIVLRHRSMEKNFNKILAMATHFDDQRTRKGFNSRYFNFCGRNFFSQAITVIFTTIYINFFENHNFSACIRIYKVAMLLGCDRKEVPTNGGKTFKFLLMLIFHQQL